MNVSKEDKELAWKCFRDAKNFASSPSNQQFVTAMLLRVNEILLKAILPEEPVAVVAAAPAPTNGDVTAH